MYEQTVINALAILRTFAKDESRNSLNELSRSAALAINALDNAGVFAALDEQTDYASAEDILAESARKAVDKELGALDPAKWGDTTRWDQLARQTCTCGRPEQTSPALHAGTCPVWAKHHNLTREATAAQHGVKASDVNWDATQH